jgi:hypothetical protein
MIERATWRIRESEPYLDAPRPPDVRVRHARRARVPLRQIPRLSRVPNQLVIDQLAAIEAVADGLIQTLSESAQHVMLD